MAFTIGANPAEAMEGGGGTATTASTALTTGRQLVVLIAWYHSTVTFTNVKYDPGGADERTFTPVGSQVAGPDDAKLHMAYLSNIPATKSTTIQATWSGGMSGSASIKVYELIGGDTTDCLDNSGSGTGSSATLSCSFDTNTASCAIFALGATAGGEPTQDTGYTLYDSFNTGWYNGTEYNLDVGVAGTKTPAMTSGSAPWGFKAAAFKLAGGVSYDAATFQAMLAQTQGGAAMIGRACRGVYG